MRPNLVLLETKDLAGLWINEMKFAAGGTILSLVDFAIVVGVDVIEPALHLKGRVWAAILK